MTIGILLFTGRSFGGVERRFGRLAAHLAAAGHDIRLYCTADGRAGLKRLGIAIPERALQIIDRPSRGRVFVDKVNRIAGLASLLRQLASSDVAHVHLAMNPGIVSAMFALLARWLPPFSLSLVDSRFVERRTLLSNWLLRRSLARARALDCLSKTLACAVQRIVKGSTSARILVSPGSFTDYSKVEVMPCRDIDLVMLSRFTPEKGFDLLRAAMASLPPCEVHVCGFGARQPDIPGARIYEADNSFAVLARARIFLSLQAYDNYPSQSLLEAMASGCAVIATNVGETRTLIDETCGILIDRTPASLVAAVSRLLADEALCRQLGEAARARVLATHTVERFATYFLDGVAGGAR